MGRVRLSPVRLGGCLMSWLSLLRCVPAILAASLPLAWPMASIGATVGGFKYTSTGGQFVSPGVSRVLSPGLLLDLMPGGNVKLTHALRPIVGGALQSGIAASQLFPWARAALLFGPIVAGVLSEGVLKDLADILRCRASGGTVAECDVGIDPTNTAPTQQTRWDAWYGATHTKNVYPEGHTSREGACSALAALMGWGYNGINSNNLTCSLKNGNSYPEGGNGTYTATIAGGSSCPGGGPVLADGKCASGVYSPHSPEQVAARMNFPSWQPLAQSRAREIAEKGLDNGVDLTPGVESPIVAGPGTITGAPTSTTTTPPGGSPTTTTSTPTTTITYEGDTYITGPTTITTTTINGPTIVTTSPTEVKTCGLPGTPACKIDETGTPDGKGTAPEASADAAATARIGAVDDHSRTSLGWSFSLGIPSGACSPFVWVTRMGTMTADPCTSAGVALWRALLAWAVGLWAALYTWRSFTSVMESN